ncbi:MAG: hypothetical protein ACOC5T_00900 [Elusimicrobiota bacterium]
MPDSADIRQEILQNIKTEDNQVLAKINEELDFMEVTEGLNGKDNLQNFYDIWEKNKGRIGSKNDINSWTAFYLGMTKNEPDGEFLQKRRAFARAGFPDIDSDFDYFRRQEIYDYIIEKYGRANVGNIGTYGGLKLKSAIRRIGKALDVAGAFHKGSAANVSENEAKVTEIVNSLPMQRGAVLKTLDKNGEEVTIKTIQDAYKHCPDFKRYIDDIPNFLEHAKNIEGLVSNFGCLSKDTPVLTDKGWVRIDELDKTRSVAFLDEEKNICFSNKYINHCTGLKKIYRLKLKDKSFIKVTDEHLIFTNKGVVSFEEIRRNMDDYKIIRIKEDIN